MAHFTQRTWLLAAGVSFAAAVAVFGMYLLVASRISADAQKLYFIIAFALATSASLILFGALKAYAKYEGNVLGGKLILGGPAVAFFGVIVSAYLFAKQPQELLVDVALQRPDNTYISEGVVVLRNEKGCFEQKTIDKEQKRAIFSSLAPVCEGNVLVETQVDGFEPVGHTPVALERSMTVQMKQIEYQCSLEARLAWQEQPDKIPERPVVDAELTAATFGSAKSDSGGIVHLLLPVKCQTLVTVTIKLPNGRIYPVPGGFLVVGTGPIVPPIYVPRELFGASK